MAILIMAATAEEMQALLPEKPLDPETLMEQRLSALPAGLLRHGKVGYYTITGVGVLNASLACASALALLQSQNISVEYILVAGLAGSYDLGRVPLCTLCQVTTEIWPEYGLNDGHEVIARAFKWPLWPKSPQGDLYDTITLASVEALEIPLSKKTPLKAASSLTVSGVSASFQRAQSLWDQYHADLENMEGFALAYCALRFHIPCLEFRCVSNKVGPRRPEEKDFSGALQNLAELLPTLTLM